jgi:hypothetical protein
MRIIPKYRVGQWVVDPTEIGSPRSESLVQIKSRKLVLNPDGPGWNYFGYAFEVSGNPIGLMYKTTVTAREDRFASIEKRTHMPDGRTVENQ